METELFEIIDTKISSSKNLMFLSYEMSFNWKENVNSDIVFMVRYLHIAFSSLTMCLNQIWGAPSNARITKTLNPPRAREGSLRIKDSKWEAGDVIWFDDWVAYRTESSGWIQIKNIVDCQLTKIDYVQVFLDVIVGINEQGDIQEIWLRPKIIDEDI